MNPAFLGIPNKGDKIKALKKQKQKISYGVLDPAYSPADCSHLGLNPWLFSCTGIALPTRIWAISDTLLHKDGIHIWSNLVFIHYWVLLKTLSILSIDTWGENPFFHPLLIQAKFASGAFGAHGPALSSQFPGRGGGGVGVKGPVPASPPCLAPPHCHVRASAQLACAQVVVEDSLGALHARQVRVPVHHP